MLAASCLAGCDNSKASGGFDTSKTITVMSREDGSGTRGAFVELFGVEQKDENAKKIEEYVRNQLQEDLEYDQMSLKEYIDPFTGEPVNKA